MGTLSIFKRIIDKVEDEVAYISIRKRLTRCLMLKIEVVVTLMIMMTMMVMMAVQSREENSSNYRDRRNDSEHDYEDENTDEYEGDEEDSEDAEETNDFNENESEISEDGTIGSLIYNNSENHGIFEVYRTNVNVYDTDHNLYQNCVFKRVPYAHQRHGVNVIVLTKNENETGT